MRSLNLVTYCGGSAAEEKSDSWDNPVRMIYLVTIQVRGPEGWRFIHLRINNFHNAEAIQRAFEGIAVVDVHIKPDVQAYLEYLRDL